MNLDWKRLSYAYCFLLVDQKIFSELALRCLHPQVHPVYHYIQQTQEQYKVFPTAEHLAAQFGLIPEHCRLEGWVEPDLADRLRSEQIRWDTLQLIANLQKVLSSNTKDLDTERILSDVSTFQEQFYAVTPTETVALSDAKKVVDEYLSADNPAVALYGYPTLDKVLGGIQQQQLIVVYANTSEGKSTLVRAISANIAQQGKKVLFFTLEESSRKSALQTFANILHFDTKAVVNKTIDPIKLREMDQYTRVAGDVIFVDKVNSKTIGEIARHVQRFQPDVIVLDQITLFTEEGDADWKAVTAVSKKLKGYCQHSRIPMIALTQATRKKSKVSLEDNMAYAYAIAQDADVVIYLYPDEPANGYVRKKIKVLKNRPGERGLELNMAWQLSNGIIQEESEFYGAPDQAIFSNAQQCSGQVEGLPNGSGLASHAAYSFGMGQPVYLPNYGVQNGPSGQ